MYSTRLHFSNSPQTEPCYPQNVPKVVVVLLGVRVQVEPQLEHVVRQKANDKHQHHHNHHPGHVSPSPRLGPTLRARVFARHVPGARMQPVRHQDVQDANDCQRKEVVHRGVDHRFEPVPGEGGNQIRAILIAENN